MKKLIWKYGLGAGLFLAIFLALSVPGMKDRIADGTGELLGYASMIIAFSVIFFAVRSHRENVLGGTITFGQAFRIGIFITLIASAIYVIAWMFLSSVWYPDFMDDYTAQILQNLEESGATAEVIALERDKMNDMIEMLKNPVIKAGVTFTEPFPVGLIISLITALILKK